ncbi:hypothetical protein V9L05_09730 [Bernardetia sp. Wsw4-3y2]|uniref:hypothetical protein n=1 Tax=Bernardetia sp. Wsw4-3y2 TaxID=3127471 RepID=UPI0030CB6EAC
MKFYILLILSILCFFSCNRKSVVDNEKTYFTEGQKKLKENIATNKSFNFNDYNDVQLDSIFRLSLDSMIDFLNVTEFEKDTVVENYFTNAMFVQAQAEFPEFVILDSKYLDLMDSIDFWECPTYIYVKKDNKLELSTTIVTSSRSWFGAEIYRRDMDFDGKLDLIISRPFYMASRDIATYHIFIKQDLNKNTTAFSTREEKLLVNNGNKTVTSFTHGGAYGIYAKTINKWKGDNLVEIRRLQRTYGTETEDDFVEEFTIKNGKEVKIKSQKMSFEEAEKYFEEYQ